MRENSAAARTGASAAFERQASMPSQKQPKAGPVEIPPNLTVLSAKELKSILDQLGVKRDDCFEKDDLVKRIEEYKINKKNGGKPPSKAPSGPSTTS